VVNNGIVMCKIDHAAYDADIFGIDPTYKVGVRTDVMKEIDGPTLRHTLQEINGSNIDLPPRRQHARTRSCWKFAGYGSRKPPRRDEQTDTG
jgi:predicted restriction endonuclease